jgi:hypothetical protein
MIENRNYISIEEAVRITRALDPSNAVIWWGSPGIAKSASIIEEFSKDHRIREVLAGCLEPTDLSGIPFAAKDADSKEETHAKYLAPDWAYECSTIAPKEFQVPTILFFDDIVTAHEQTQAAFFRVIREKMVGNLTLRDNVRLIAAGNNVDDKSAATDMPKALCNRFVHLYVRSDSEVWLKWARKNLLHPSILAFISSQPNYLDMFEEVISKGSGDHAFPTPRSWHILSNTLFNLEGDSLDGNDSNKMATVFGIAAGVVGQGVASIFTTYLKSTKDLIPPQEIVKDPDNCRVPPKEKLDILHATVAAAGHYVNQPANHKHWEAFLKYALRIQPELGIILSRQTLGVIMEKLPDKEKVAAGTTPLLNEVYDKWGKLY